MDMAVTVDHVHLFIKNVSQKWFVTLQNIPLAGLRSGGKVELAVLCDMYAVFAVIQMYNLFWIGAISSGGSPGLGAHKLTLLYKSSMKCSSSAGGS
jgi:hypothetical protein